MSDQGLRPPPTDWRPPATVAAQSLEPPHAAVRQCPYHHEVGPAARFCDVCGAPVAELSPVAAPEAVPGWSPARPSGQLTSRHIVLGTVGLALVFAVLVVGSLVHLRQPSSPAPASVVVPAAAPPATTTVTGTLTLDDDETAQNDCVGEGGYADIEPGATVILTDESGKILGSSSLGVSSATSSGLSCVFPFTIADVPTDAAQYAVEVTHRGKVVNSRQDLEATAWTFALTLGS